MSCYQFLAIVCLPKMVFKKLRRVTAIACVLLAQWGKGKWKVGKYRLIGSVFSRCRLLVILYRCSQLCLYQLRCLDVIAQTYTLSFQCNDPFYAGGQLEKAVIKLTYGDYNGKYSFESTILNT